MAPFFDQLIFNAAAATLMAPVAYASRCLNRPSMTHALWLLVLARLVAPPLWTVPWPKVRTDQPVSPSMSVEPIPMDVSESVTPDETILDEPTPEPLSPVEAIAAPVQDWAAALTVAWAMSSGAFLLLAACRSIRFNRALRWGRPASAELQALVAKLTRRVGLRRPPRLVILPGRVSPCVWWMGGRPVMLLPAGWAESMRPLARAAVLVHELAHLRRGDHFVRWFETLVTGLCWWHPVVWLARGELRAAEEACCDAWVVATLPAARRAYADALVDTVAFLTPAPALPPLASGLGQVQELKRRIHMILTTNPARRPGRAGAAVALGLGLLLLPFGLARSDDPPEAERAERQARERAEAAQRDAEEARWRAERVSKERLEAAERAVAQAGDARRDPGNRDRALDELRAELRNARRQAEEAQRRIEQLQEALRRFSGDAVEPARPARAPRAAAEPSETPRPPRPPVAPRPPEPAITPVPTVAPAVPRLRMLEERAARAGTPVPDQGSDRRLEALERQIELLRREMAEMRRELQRRPTNGTDA